MSTHMKFYPLPFAFVLLMSQFQLTGAVNINLGDRDVLEVLYNSTNGGNWTLFSDWDFNTTDCNAFKGGPPVIGAICNVDGRVKRLDLTGNNLNGIIPTDLGNLTLLEKLFLNINNLIGNIPTEFGNLVGLQQLRLNVNDLHGVIPTEFGNLILLDRLFLGDNSLTGDIPTEFGSLNQLEQLLLENNDLTGVIPTEFGNLVKLDRLFMFDNYLCGMIPTEFGNLTLLTNLNLRDNDLTGLIPTQLDDLEALTRLLLHGNCFDCPNPNLCDNITTCDIGTCGICCDISDLPEQPVDKETCSAHSCDEIECDGCEIPCQGSTVVLTCINSVWTAPIPEDMCTDCEPNPCYNDGTCGEITGGFMCTCKPGFDGPLCGNSINYCSTVECANSGTCINDANGFLCCCVSGFHGEFCGEADDKCAPNPCHNGGECTEDDDGFICTCKDGYEGQTCGIEIDECAVDPCLNDGTCFDEENSFSCCCKKGFGGDRCEVVPCRPAYHIDVFNRSVTRDFGNCGRPPGSINAKKKRYEKIITKKRQEKQYATLIHFGSLAGSAFFGFAVTVVVMKLRSRR